MTAPARLDHLVYATPDVDATVGELADRFGVRAVAGGRHPGLGTRNALLALGPGSYLEIIGPDGESPPSWFGIASLAAPKLVTWAVKDTALEARAAEAARAGFPLGPVESGGRVRPDGERLSWRFTHPRTLSADGIVPFFIDWGSGPHPSDVAPQGVRLLDLRAEHPSPVPIASLLRKLEIDLRVERGDEPRLAAELETPRGRVRLG